MLDIIVFLYMIMNIWSNLLAFLVDFPSKTIFIPIATKVFKGFSLLVQVSRLHRYHCLYIIWNLIFGWSNVTLTFHLNFELYFDICNYCHMVTIVPTCQGLMVPFSIVQGDTEL